MNCNTTHYRANSSSVPGDPTALSPPPTATAGLLASVERDILVPIVDGLRADGAPYRGVLYAGLMLTGAGPKVLEFNCRLGDPEAQVVLPRLRTDFVELVEAVLGSRLDEGDLEWDSRAAVGVVMASKGYPSAYDTGRIITGLGAAAALPDVHVYHAGTKAAGERTITNGGRVLTVTGMGTTLAEARQRAYDAVQVISFDGASYRRDIADFRFPISD